MRHETLARMSEVQLDAYADLLGIDTRNIDGVDAKVDEIESRRGRVAEVGVLGITVTIPMKRLHDRRIMDRYSGKAMTNSTLEDFIRDLVGDDQMDAIRDACTDEDGTVDSEALLYAYTCINGADELKNF